MMLRGMAQLTEIHLDHCKLFHEKVEGWRCVGAGVEARNEAKHDGGGERDVPPN